MADLSATVLAQLKRYGQACTISWPGKGTGSMAVPAQTATSYIRIRERSFVNQAGALQTLIQGMMPPTARNLQGATIRVGNRIYTVQGNAEKVSQGAVFMQQVTLV